MASNPKPSPTNAGKSASQVTRDMLLKRRQNPVVPTAPEPNHAGMRSKSALQAGKQERASGGGGARPAPAASNAVDRTHAKREEERANRANRGK
jgi:hypothetical protein